MSQHIEEYLPIDLSDAEPLQLVLNATVMSDDRSKSLENQLPRKNSSVMERLSLLKHSRFSLKTCLIVPVILCLLDTPFAAEKWYMDLEPKIEHSKHLQVYQTCSESKGKTLDIVDDP